MLLVNIATCNLDHDWEEWYEMHFIFNNYLFIYKYTCLVCSYLWALNIPYDTNQPIQFVQEEHNDKLY